MKAVRRIFMSSDATLRSGWAIVAFIILIGLLFSGQAMLAQKVERATLLTTGMWTFSSAVSPALLLAATLLATGVACALVRQRLGVLGLGGERRWARLAFGGLLGLGLQTLTVSVPFVLGKLSLEPSGDSLKALAIQAVWLGCVFVPAACMEELLMRGFVFQQLTRGLGRWAALTLTSLVFGVAHLNNPHASWAAAANITLVGLWLGLLLLATDSLWLPIGVHISWNIAEGYIFGQPVSGMLLEHTLLIKTEPGSLAWTGGAFGPEASWWMTFLLVGCCLATLARYRAKPNKPQTRAPEGDEESQQR